MIVEIAAGRKRLATVVTLVGLLPGVDPPVGVEAAARAEPLLTEVAHVRPLEPEESFASTSSTL